MDGVHILSTWLNLFWCLFLATCLAKYHSIIKTPCCEWHVVRCSFDIGHQNDKCWKDIGLRVLHTITFLSSTIIQLEETTWSFNEYENFLQYWIGYSFELLKSWGKWLCLNLDIVSHLVLRYVCLKWFVFLTGPLDLIGTWCNEDQRANIINTQEIGPHLQIWMNTLHSIMNIIGMTYVSSYKINKHALPMTITKSKEAWFQQKCPIIGLC